MAIYTDSKGREHIVAEMPYTYLKNALAKLERQYDPENEVLIAEMKAEVRRRDEAYADEQAAEVERVARIDD